MEEQKFSSSSFAEVWSFEFDVFQEKLRASARLLQQPLFPAASKTPRAAPRRSNILHSLRMKPAKPSITHS